MPISFDILLALLIGGVEWTLALRRTLACMRGEVGIVVGIVAVENILSFWVTLAFVRDENWGIAVAYTLGAVLATWLTLVSEKATRRKV